MASWNTLNCAKVGSDGPSLSTRVRGTLPSHSFSQIQPANPLPSAFHAVQHMSSRVLAARALYTWGKALQPPHVVRPANASHGAPMVSHGASGKAAWLHTRSQCRKLEQENQQCPQSTFEQPTRMLQSDNYTIMNSKVKDGSRKRQ